MNVGVGTTLWRTTGHPDWNKGMDAWPSEIEHMLWQVQVAEQGGFDSIWLTEHHFSHWSSASAPSVILSHLAAITNRIRIGYGIALVPLHHPVHLVSEMLWVDQLSKGRLNVGLGRGHVALEFAAFGASFETDRASFEECLAIIRPALEGKPVQLDGEHWKIPFLQISPGPYQKPHPPVHIVTTSEHSMRSAIHWRAHPILGVDSPAVLKQQLDRFRELAFEEGLQEPEIDHLLSKAKCTRRLICSLSRAEAEEEMLRGFAELDAAWRRGMKPVGDPSAFDEWVPVSAADFADRQGSTMPGGELHHVFLGTPDDIVEQIRSLEAETGIHYMSTAISSPGVDRAFAERNVRHLVESVLPRVR